MLSTGQTSWPVVSSPFRTRKVPTAHSKEKRSSNTNLLNVIRRMIILCKQPHELGLPRPLYTTACPLPMDMSIGCTGVSIHSCYFALEFGSIGANSSSSSVYVVHQYANRLCSSLQHLGSVQDIRRVPLLSGRKHVSRLPLRFVWTRCADYRRLELDSGPFRCPWLPR